MSPLQKKERIHIVDRMRGMVMVLMTLDHTRVFFSNIAFDPTDLSHTSVSLFFTRWITHLCAPVFVFLVGVGMSLYVSAGKTKREAALFLLTRGIWILLIEFTLAHLGWTFTIDLSLKAQVLWAIGLCMITLAGMIFLPSVLMFVVAVAVIAGHNLLDGHEAVWLASFDWLHVPKILYFTWPSGGSLRIGYPPVPWMVLPALGYLVGPIFLLDRSTRAKYLWGLGLSCLVLFTLLRYINGYGDPHPWFVQANALLTFMSFLNVTKYPPSLLYLLVTLGIMFLLMVLLESFHNWLMKVLETFGKVPFFYYLAHLFVIHSLAFLIAWLRFGQTKVYVGSVLNISVMARYGYSLPVVYLIWLLVVSSLYPVCKWYGGVKQRHRDSWWASYL